MKRIGIGNIRVPLLTDSVNRLMNFAALHKRADAPFFPGNRRNKTLPVRGAQGVPVRAGPHAFLWGKMHGTLLTAEAQRIVEKHLIPCNIALTDHRQPAAIRSLGAPITHSTNSCSGMACILYLCIQVETPPWTYRLTLQHKDRFASYPPAARSARFGCSRL